MFNITGHYVIRNNRSHSTLHFSLTHKFVYHTGKMEIYRRVEPTSIELRMIIAIKRNILPFAGNITVRCTLSMFAVNIIIYMYM